MTERFTVSRNFSSESKKIIKAALKLSKLPEGVSAVCWDESVKAKKPFVVIAHSTRWEDARNAFEHGALNYVSFSYNPNDLARKLDREE